MASQEHLVTSAPAALAGVAPGRTYFLQNTRGRRSILRVAVKASASDVNVDQSGFTLLFGAGQPVSVEAGESVFVWHDAADGDFYCAYDETA